MGEVDKIARIFENENDVFAEMFNVGYFKGSYFVDPGSLHNRLTQEVDFGSSKNGKLRQTERDLIKEVLKTDGKVAYLLLAVENQKHVDYAMPWRVMDYDNGSYRSQIDHLKAINKDNSKGATNAEFVSGLRKEDRLIPVITLVVYLGDKPWDGPRSLKEMFDVDPELEPFISDYRMNLIEPLTMSDDDLNQFQTNLREIFGIIRYSRDPEKQKQFIKNNPRLEHVTKATANFMLEMYGKKIDFPEEQEVVNMNQAFNQILQSEFEEGQAKKEAEINEILDLLLKGKSNSSIAQKLNINEDKVEFYRKYIRPVN